MKTANFLSFSVSSLLYAFQFPSSGPHTEVMKRGIDILKWETATLFFDFPPLVPIRVFIASSLSTYSLFCVQTEL